MRKLGAVVLFLLWQQVKDTLFSLERLFNTYLLNLKCEKFPNQPSYKKSDKYKKK